MSSLPAGYRLEELPCEPGSSPDEGATAWIHAVDLGFNQDRESEVKARTGWQLLATDAARVYGVYATDQPAALANPAPVATYASFDGTVNTGRELASSNFVSEVTVRNSHRRRGLLRAMITHDLGAARARGQAFASLTASEGSIYQRFGFGVAAQELELRINSPREVRWYPTPERPTDLIAVAQSAAVHDTVFSQWHQQFTGSHSRAAGFSTRVAAGLSRTEEPTFDLYTAATVDAAGQVDGLITYKYSGQEPNRELVVVEVLALNDAAELALWRHACVQDLISAVVASRVPVDSPITWATRDARAVGVTAVNDSVWLRVLDVPAALQRRAWFADGSVVVEVIDPLGFAAGRWRIAVDGGQAEVTTSAADPDLTLSAAALASLFTGATRVRTLAAAGQISGQPDAVTTADAIFATPRPARNSSFF